MVYPLVIDVSGQTGFLFGEIEKRQVSRSPWNEYDAMLPIFNWDKFGGHQVLKVIFGNNNLPFPCLCPITPMCSVVVII
jgi:hypothetical protein